jgi:hypothetical protein
MTYNAILVIECLVEDYGWDAVMDELMKEAATASDEHLNEVKELLDAAITVNEGKGQLFVPCLSGYHPHPLHIGLPHTSFLRQQLANSRSVETFALGNDASLSEDGRITLSP